MWCYTHCSKHTGQIHDGNRLDFQYIFVIDICQRNKMEAAASKLLHSIMVTTCCSPMAKA